MLVYTIYFSYFSILRYKTLYASYYDLGIMHQTVYNTYSSIKTGDWSRFLELTNPMGADQIKRMAIHNDILLALLSPFYFIYSGPEMLLIIQSVVIALGALAIYKLSSKILKHDLLSLIFSISYLFYFPLQRANIFDFHAVALATTFLLFMFYFWTVKKYFLSFIFFILSILSKEQVALTTLFFGIYILYSSSLIEKNNFKNRSSRLRSNNKLFSTMIIVFSLIWFILSLFFIIPYFRGSDHFAVARYSDFGDSPMRIITGILTNPIFLFKYIFRESTLSYFNNLLGPVGFLSLLSPIHLLIALPEFVINLLSKNPNMRNMIYHYTAVITPFVFISAIYGVKKIINYFSSKVEKNRKLSSRQARTVNLKRLYLTFIILFFSFSFAFFKGPLPFAKSRNIHPFKYPQKETTDTAFWAKTLQNEQLKISTTGQLSPFFTSRRYFYTFSDRYVLADYIVLRLNEIYNYPEKNELIPVYEKLKKDNKYELIYQKENFEVYKKI